MDETYAKGINNPKNIEIEKLTKETISNFKKEIENSDVYDKLDKHMSADPNSNFNILSKILNTAKTRHIPKSVKKFNKRKHTKEKWMTNDLLKLVVKKNERYVEWKTTPVAHPNYELRKQNFKTYKYIVSQEIVNAKKSYYNRTFAMYKNNLKKTWLTISETLNRNKIQDTNPISFIDNGHELSDNTEIANAFNLYFANVGKKLSATLEQHNVLNINYKHYLQTPKTTSCKFKLINEHVTLTTIDKLENKTSCGHDGISNKLLKCLKHELSKSLTLIINQMLTTGIFPESLKLSKITPIYKKGDRVFLENYRPISLLPTISKIFERVIHDQLYDYFNSNNLLAAQQYGFRPQHSTEYAAVKLVDHTSSEMENQKIPTAVFIDLSKAFDTLSYDILLYKLKYYGVTGTEFKLMQNYLSNRKQYVVFNNCNSDITEINIGVPQGSILGPLLFSININDLITVSNKLHFIMYADDTTIYFNLEDFNQENLENEVNNELSRVSEWMTLNKLSLNASKTKSMTFHRAQKKVNQITLKLNGQNIEMVSSFNFLGIILDQSLSWKKHVSMVTNKISKTLGILYRLKDIFPENILLTIYQSLIASHMNYGLLVWGIECHRLEKVQKKAIRLITNSKYIAHTNPLFCQLNLLKIKDIFKLRLLKFYYKLTCDLLPSYFNTYLDVINRAPPRQLRINLIHQPVIKRNYAKCGLLYQLVDLLNSLQINPNDTILAKIYEKSHSYNGFAFNVTRIYLDTYDPVCRLRYCYVCERF